MRLSSIVQMSRRKFLPQGLLGRSLLILIIPLLIVQAVTVAFFFDRHLQSVMRQMAGGIAGDVAIMLALRERFPDPADHAMLLDLAQKTLDLTVVFRPETRLSLLSDDENLLEQTLGSALRNRIRQPFTLNARAFLRMMTIRVQVEDGVLDFVLPRKRLYSSTTYVFLFWMAGTALIVFGIAVLFMSNQIRSIRRLAAGAEGFGKGWRLPPLKIEGAREVRQAALAFNIMRNRIKRQMTQRTEMLAGVSHDLRTPLTRMRLQLAMMGTSPETGALLEDVAEMEMMIDGYLAFARGEEGEEAQNVDLASFLKGIVAKHQRTNAAIELARPATRSPLSVTVRRMALERCLSNLIDNAFYFGDRVRIGVRKNPRQGEVEIEIEDNGPGIPPALREDVFRPFFRKEPSRNRRTGGVGLGLTIARDVARTHGGDLTLHDSAALGGLKAVVRLPV